MARPPNGKRRDRSPGDHPLHSPLDPHHKNRTGNDLSEWGDRAGVTSVSPDVASVLRTCHVQLDGIVDLATDAVLHDERLAIVELVGPLGRVADRQRAALQAVGVT